MDKGKKLVVLFVILVVILTLILFFYLIKIQESNKPVLDNTGWDQVPENGRFDRARVVVEETVRGLSLSRQNCEEETGQFWCINYYKIGSNCVKNKIGVGERNYKEWYDYWALQKEAVEVVFNGIRGYNNISSGTLDLASVYLDNYSFTASINLAGSSDCVDSSQKDSIFSSKIIMNLLTENINKYYKK